MSTSSKVSNVKTIEFSGQTRRLKMDFNALAHMEDELGMSALDGSIFKQESLSQARVLRAVLYACMRSAGEDISLEEVGAGLDIHNVAGAMQAVASLLAPEGDGGQPEEGKR